VKVRLSASRVGRPIPAETFLVLIPFRGHCASGRIISIEKFNDVIRNGIRDLPACSKVPKPTTLSRARGGARINLVHNLYQIANWRIISNTHAIWGPERHEYLDLRLCQLCLLVSCLYFSVVKIEAKYSSKMSLVFHRSTRRYIPEDGTLHNHHCENIKSYT
jgi:hypothetical protein